jgi:predicted DsbA family dithiol-disulfide isomerase
MEAERVRGYLASDEGVAELEMELAGAREMGIQAVPTFLIEGQYVVQGAQSASVFLQALEEVEKRMAAPAPGAGGDGCDDGSCAV